MRLALGPIPQIYMIITQSDNEVLPDFNKEAARKATSGQILADFPADLDTYLIEVFWNRYNNALRIIDQQAFSRDRGNGDSTYYSPFLYLVCLAMGFRFANKSRQDMRQMTLNNGCSLFQREAKCVLDYELESPRGLTTIQAILVLSDVECAYGRDDLATIYVGISCRLAFDFGLNLDCSELGLSEGDMKFRNKLLRSCIIYDRAWALYLGRPTYIKLCDISSSCLNKPITSEALSSDEDIQEQILDALIDLSELCSRIQEVAQPRLSPGPIADENRLTDVAALDTELKSWYSTLPSRLRWTPDNVKNARRLFFIMHQQYLVSEIILHGPYGHYEDLVGIELDKSHVFRRRGTECSNISLWRRLARAITINAAMKIAQGFATYRKRFGVCETSFLSLQQGGTAFLALMCNIKASRTAEERSLVLRHLYVLMGQLQEMSEIFSPARVMCSVVKREMGELQIDFSELLTPPQIPDLFDSRSPTTRAQRASSKLSDSGPAVKRHRLNAHCQSTTAPRAWPPNPGPNQSLLFRDMTLAEEPAHISLMPPETVSFGVANGPLSVTLPVDNFEPPDHTPHLSELNVATFSWPMDFSDTSALFDGQSQDHPTNDNQLPWLSDNHLFDGVDPGLC
ncbi:uncharacterized protein A1O5_07694 [Cladophialophora psammophila CBS 110553]|uniref:Xylanolytic transcriptional activator regulatory domain-containing protein n=1 Tax=Cladophialophora psammophila CBS 110553 TaxID=1182543 RepID=W9WLG8_9EURO|nr:uncharacterized protein A1O5_07694 [Cladophialophora psammophila CBS 110553]EXJ68763.1 hypothetical protein A1O5_07694 [Cladophialophora psammophila CBS 110553]